MHSPSADGAREQIKLAFIAQRGYWRPWVDTLLQESPQFVAQYARYAGFPAKNGPLSERMVELIYVALDASATHMFEAGLATHMQRALEVGATPAEIFDVLHLVAVQGLAAVGAAAGILQALAPEADSTIAHRPIADTNLPARMTAAEASHGLALHAVAKMDPAYAQVVLDFVEHGAPSAGLSTRERCLVQLALQGSFTAFQPQAVRALMASALQQGCSKAEIFQTIQLGAHLAVHGTALGARVYRQVSETNPSPSKETGDKLL